MPFWWNVKHFVHRVYWVCLGRFLDSISHLATWVPTLWEDRNCDESFMFAIFEFKLRQMEKCLRNGHHLDRDRDANHCLEAAILCNRMSDRWRYDDNVSEYHPPEKSFDENHHYVPGNFTTRGCVPNLKIWQFKSGEFSPSNYEDYMFAQDLDRFCLLLKKYCRSWWD